MNRVGGMAAALLLLALVAMSAPARSAAAEGWCGGATGDWACRLTGKVEVAGHSAQERSVPADSLVATSVHAQARVAFGTEALCTLGGFGVPSTIVTRPPGEGTLFRQRTGSSTCSDPTGESTIEVLCVKGERCPVEVEAQGLSLIRIYPSGTAATASSADVHRSARIISCGGHLEVRAETVSGGSSSISENAGSGSYGQPFEIFVSETIESTTRENGIDVNVETSSVARSLHAPGLCGSEPVQEQSEAKFEQTTTTTTVNNSNGNVVIG